MKRMKIVTVLVLILGLFFIPSNLHLLAAFSKFNVKDIEVESTTDTITVDWKDIGEEYEVLLDNELHTITSNNQITIADLEEGTPYGIVVKAKDKNDILDVVTVQTLTNKAKSESLPIPEAKDSKEETTENNFSEGSTTAIFNDHEAKVIFENVPDDDLVYEVEKDNVSFGKLRGKKNFLIDKNLKPDTQYRYSLIGKEKLTGKEKAETTKLMKEKNISPSLVNVEEIEKEFELARTFKTMEKEVSNQVEALNWDDPGVGAMFVYTTFIPMDYFTFKARYPGTETEMPSAPFKYNKFKGDGTNGVDRQFDRNGNSPKYRTRTWARVSFPEQGGSNVYFGKDANPTHALNKNTGNWTSKNADMSDVYMKKNSLSNVKAEFYVYHNARNELHDLLFIPSPGITYHYWSTVYKSGFFEIQGSHDQAPNHELSYTQVPGEIHPGYSTYAHLFKDELSEKYKFDALFGAPLYPQKRIHEQGTWKWF